MNADLPTTIPAYLDRLRRALEGCDPALAQELRAQHAQAPDAVLSLDSSGDAEYRTFVQALAAARNAGYRDIAVKR